MVLIAVMGMIAIGGCLSRLVSAPDATTAKIALLSTPPSTGGQATGVYGYVTAGPTCPVERPDRPCPPRPVTAHIAAASATGILVGATSSDAGGLYRLTLAAGTYTLFVSNGNIFPRCPPTRVVVTAGHLSRNDIQCDTGIR
jgi:hypothetical protein